MSRNQPRKRRPISVGGARLLPWLGFRYSIGRQAYVLRLVGDWFGPVYQLRSQLPDASVSEPALTAPDHELNAIYGGPQHPRPTRSPQGESEREGRLDREHPRIEPKIAASRRKGPRQD